MRTFFALTLLMFAVAFAGCKPDGGGNPESASIAINGTPQVGEKLTATSTGTGFSGDFVWQFADTENAAVWVDVTGDSYFSGTGNCELTLARMFADKFVRAKRTNSSGEKISNVVGPILNPLQVSITGNAVVGQKLTATSTEGDDFIGNFIWAYSDASEGPVGQWTWITDNIGGTDNSELTLTAALTGKYIRAVRNASGVEPSYPLVPSEPVGPVTTTSPLRIAAATTSAAMTASVNEPVSAILEPLDGSDRTYGDAGMSGL